jgi:hypothetical protein
MPDRVNWWRGRNGMGGFPIGLRVAEITRNCKILTVVRKMKNYTIEAHF